MADKRPHITIYTDGGCDPNPGPGGWGAILIHPQKTRELSGSAPDTTNNRMELTAAVEALRALNQPCIIDWYTDSEYLKKGITAWIETWAANGWRRDRSRKTPIANADLWQELYRLRQSHTITWHWVRGHSGDPYNERVDALASAAILQPQPTTDPSMTCVYLRIAGKQTEGPFGWAASIVRGEKTQRLWGGHPHLTMNHFLLHAALAVLHQVPATEPIQFYTNSSFLYDGLTKWVHGWRKSGWKKPRNFRAEWQALDRLNQTRAIRWVRIRDQVPDEYRALEKLVTEARDAAETMPAPPPLVDDGLSDRPVFRPPDS